MKTVLFIAFALIHSTAGSTYAVEYSVTKLIEVDSTTEGGVGGTFRWSPDGNTLAFVMNSELWLTDTLGHARLVKKITQPPKLYEWISNDELAMHYWIHPGGNKGADHRLTIIDIHSREETAIAEYHPTIGYFGGNQFRGPFLTHKGRAFFGMEGYTDKVVGSRTIGRHFFGEPLSAKDSSDDFIIHWLGTNKVYKLFLDGRDSAILCIKPGFRGTKAVMSVDENRLILGQHIVELSSGEVTDIMQFAGPTPPDAYGCMAYYSSFNPEYPEVVFIRECESSESIVFEKVGVFNYATNDYFVLDSLVELENCMVPIYHQNGDMITFRSGGRLFMAWLRRDIE